jgi:hypothetical protein
VLSPERQEGLLGVGAVHGADRPRHIHRVGVEGGGGRLELRLAPVEGGAGGGGGQIDVLAQGEVEPGSERGRGSHRATWVAVRELLRDGAGQRITDHRHVGGGRAQAREGAGMLSGRLLVDHALERHHVVLHQIGDDVLGQVRVGRGQEGAEVLGVADQIGHRLVLLGLVLGGHAHGVVHREADVLSNSHPCRWLGPRASVVPSSPANTSSLSRSSTQ